MIDGVAVMRAADNLPTITPAGLATDQLQTLRCTKDSGLFLSTERIYLMADKRRKFSPQFKAEAVQMVVESDKTIAQVARDLGVVEQTLGNWVKAWRDANPEPEPKLSPTERARMNELEEEVRRLRMENEFLKKAAAFFARTQP